MSELANLVPQALAVVGALAFLVTVVTEVIKSLGIFKKVPTDLVVIVLSLAITLVAFFAYMDYAKVAVLWYYVVAAITLGFIVAFIAMYGWAKISEIWQRFTPKK